MNMETKRPLLPHEAQAKEAVEKTLGLMLSTVHTLANQIERRRGASRDVLWESGKASWQVLYAGSQVVGIEFTHPEGRYNYPSAGDHTVPLRFVQGHLKMLEDGMKTYLEYLRHEASHFVNGPLIVDANKEESSDEWSIVKFGDRKIGKFKWDMEKIQLTGISLTADQAALCDLDLYQLILKRLQEEALVPATVGVMNFLLRNPELISGEWIGTNICFWGSPFAKRKEPAHLYIPCLSYNPDGEYWMRNMRRVLPATAKRRNALLLKV